MEDTTVTLTGTAKEQSDQWRKILKKIYEAENEISVDLIDIETSDIKSSNETSNLIYTNTDSKESSLKSKKIIKDKPKKKPWPAG